MKFLFQENKYDNLATFVASDRSPFFATEGTLIILSRARNKQNIAVEIPSVLYCVGVGNIGQRVQITVQCTPS